MLRGKRFEPDRKDLTWEIYVPTPRLCASADIVNAPGIHRHYSIGGIQARVGLKS